MGDKTSAAERILRFETLLFFPFRFSKPKARAASFGCSDEGGVLSPRWHLKPARPGQGTEMGVGRWMCGPRGGDLLCVSFNEHAGAEWTDRGEGALARCAAHRAARGGDGRMGVDGRACGGAAEEQREGGGPPGLQWRLAQACTGTRRAAGRNTLLSRFVGRPRANNEQGVFERAGR